MSEQYVGRHVRARLAVGFLPVPGHPFDAGTFAGYLAQAVADRFGSANIACSDLGNPLVEVWTTGSRSNYWALADVWLNMGDAAGTVSVAGLRQAFGNALAATGAARRVAAASGSEAEISSMAASVFAEAAQVSVVGADTSQGVGNLPWPVSFDAAWTLDGSIGALSAPDCRSSARSTPTPNATLPPNFRQVPAEPLPTPSSAPPLQEGVRNIVTTTATSVGRIIVLGSLGAVVVGALVGVWLLGRRGNDEPTERRNNPGGRVARDLAELRRMAAEPLSGGSGRGPRVFDSHQLMGLEAALDVAWSQGDDARDAALPAWRAYVAEELRQSPRRVDTTRRFAAKPTDPTFRFDVLSYAINNAWASLAPGARTDGARKILRDMADRYSVSLPHDLPASRKAKGR